MIIFGDKPMFSHMPFLHDAGGSVSMLLCLSDKLEKPRKISYRAWKIHSYDIVRNVATRVDTGTDALDVECSPVCYYQNGLFTLSFILGKWSQELEDDEYTDLRLYKMTGKSLFDLDEITPVLPFKVRAGFDWFGKAVFSTGDGRVMHDNIDGVGRYETDVGLEQITRLVPRYDHSTTVLVTGYPSGSDSVKTLVYDLESRKVTGEVKAPDGKVAYKPTLFEKMMAHVVEAGDEAEEEYKVEFLKDIG